METITIHPQNDEQLKAIKSVLKALKIPFEKGKDSYDPDFVKMLEDAEKDREGAITLESPDDLDTYFKNLGANV